MKLTCFLIVFYLFGCGSQTEPLSSLSYPGASVPVAFSLKFKGRISGKDFVVPIYSDLLQDILSDRSIYPTHIFRRIRSKIVGEIEALGKVSEPLKLQAVAMKLSRFSVITASMLVENYGGDVPHTVRNNWELESTIFRLKGTIQQDVLASIKDSSRFYSEFGNAEVPKHLQIDDADFLLEYKRFLDSKGAPSIISKTSIMSRLQRWQVNSLFGELIDADSEEAKQLLLFGELVSASSNPLEAGLTLALQRANIARLEGWLESLLAGYLLTGRRTLTPKERIWQKLYVVQSKSGHDFSFFLQKWPS